MADAPVTTRPYHHGKLRDTLVDAAMGLARADGPSGVGLRAASRLAGVSHNAAYRHFADLDDLLAAVGDRCMAELAALMRARLARVRTRNPVERAWERLHVIGEAYVDFAVTETGWFRTAFAARDHPTGAAAGARSESSPYDLLSDRLDDLVAAGAVPAERRPGLELAAWSAVHGFSMLVVDGPLRAMPVADRKRALRTVLEVNARGL